MDGVGDGESTGSGFESLRTASTAADLLVLCAVPAVLLAVATLPVSVRQSLVFEYADPTLRTAVASSFVHIGPQHLAVNLVGYLLVVPVTYLLSTANGERWQFRVAFAALLLVCPPVLSYLNLAIVRTGGSAGFSGVLLALYGYLPLALASHAEGQLSLGRQRTTAPLLFFIGLTLIAVLTLGAVLTYGVTVPVRGRTVAVGHVLTATLVGLLAALVLVLRCTRCRLPRTAWPGVRASGRPRARRATSSWPSSAWGCFWRYPSRPSQSTPSSAAGY
ncbi:hypothetical protein ACFQER_06345 [Halomicroarcula sp. GCM10025894]|uniref:hypothetical protein n=1 Tax=Halomicroarcula sp. GCM10025894 TaxID=3252673 RepID=UPI003620FF61